MATRLGWIGPAIVALGVVVAGLGVWVMVTGRPEPGAVIDELDLGDGARVVIRDEHEGRSFVELHEHGELKWQALVPRYAGRRGVPAIAWSDVAVTVRVVRDGKAEIFALARANASKLGGTHLASDKGPIRADAAGPRTVHDGLRSYELVAGDDWQRVLAFDLRLGRILWQRDVATTDIEAAGVDGGVVWIQQAGAKRFFDVFTGKDNRTRELVGDPPEGVPPAWPTEPRPDDVAPPAGSAAPR